MYQRVKKQQRRTVGTSSTLRAIERDRISEVYIARDVDRHVLNPVIAICKEKGVKINWVDCQGALGAACGMKLATSTVGFLRDDV
ncbi:ribosomal L7Ae/L30e/S12e/Gadd45 family protein [Ferroacidibacillus organovorans]|uniref:Ribosomal protein eL8/eL30/eS12/Gadd45 domain-containing protein n=1 Tax=Ferroacidibacillus organovorans TaxID=1765683 RepID=A0A162SCG2_9BACL|nr:ribosomal L7Ae/L30e/S12e/Gadd45 family protein [Ferroacidibacillus organovorans]KYP79702.1 hypothetical protein AYJ22_03880 [Ferroacidibacillus organovorans]OAG94796.1 hypothetical protein AYW79_03300 [Ferroacidibacillus organovorans]OPG14893.1 hypothetical protein B2M26_14670 [Ferroacidibacillus organovorans]